MFAILSILVEAEQKTSRTSAAAVYHRDYLKTRNKPYRKYNEKRKRKSED